VTLSEVNTLFSFPSHHISLNEEGNAAILWTELSEPSLKKCLKSASRTKDQWSAPSLVFVSESFYDDLGFFIDKTNNVNAIWEEYVDGFSQFQIASKSADGAWKTAQKLWDQKTSSKISILPNGKDNFLVFSCSELPPSPGKWQSSYALTSTEISPSTGEKKTQTLGIGNASFGDVVTRANENNYQFVFWEKDYDSPNYVPQRTFAASWRQNNGNWSSLETISLSGPSFKYIHDPKLAIDAENNVCIIGKAVSVIGEDECETVWALTRSSDGKWSGPIFISPPSAKYIRELQIAVDPAGNFLVIWSIENSKKEVFYATYKPKNQPWTPSSPFTSPTEVNFNPILRAGPAQTFVVTWAQIKQLKHSSVHGATFSGANQSWSHPVQLSPLGQQSLLTAFDLNSKGEGVISWVWQRHITESFLQVAKISLTPPPNGD
jgi:hypothetical protein